MTDEHPPAYVAGRWTRGARLRTALPSRRGAWEPGPLVLLVPVATLLLVVLWKRAQAPDAPQGARPAPEIPASVGDTLVAGWEGSAGLLSATLAPLHAGPGRQAFDARTLGARFGHGEGEAWRLTLRAASPAADADAAAVIEDLRAVRVPGLVPLVPAAGERPAADPVAALLRSPELPLLPGQAIDLWHFGPVPTGTLSLEGTVAPLELAPTQLDVPRATGALATVDPTLAPDVPNEPNEPDQESDR